MHTDILFLGLARDCAPTLPTFFDFLERLRRSGFLCSAFIGEDGSKDSTHDLLVKANDIGVSWLDTGFMQKEKYRLRRMALGREFLLNHIQHLKIDAEIICVLDLDTVFAVPPAIAAVQRAVETIRQDNSLFAVSATSHPVYYDLYSFRATGYEHLENIHAQFEKAKKSPITFYSFLTTNVYPVERQITSSIPLRCASSFNGMCFYRGADYMAGSYRSPEEANICEHVTFNRSIGQASGKTMLIADDLILKAPKEHSPTSLGQLWIRQLTRRLSGSLRKRGSGRLA